MPSHTWCDLKEIHHIQFGDVHTTRTELIDHLKVNIQPKLIFELNSLTTVHKSMVAEFHELELWDLETS